MNTTQLIQAFKIGMDKVNALSNPSFEQEEILFFLNKAKDRFEENLYLGRHSKGTSFDETERMKKALARITVSWSAGVSPTESPWDEYNYIPIQFNAAEITMPSNLRYCLREYGLGQFATSEQCKMATTMNVYLNVYGTNNNFDNKVTFERVKMLPVYTTRHNDLAHALQDPFVKPDNDTLLRIDADGAHVIASATSYSLVAYFLQYMRYSAEITMANTYELPEWTHQKIVDLAVGIALENIESPRMQTAMLDQIKND